jgi:hypothetical protein
MFKFRPQVIPRRKFKLPRHFDFYNQIRSDGLFEHDIYQALASLSSTMFQNKNSDYNEWLKKKIPALDNYTPAQLSSMPHGMNWIREYLIRLRLFLCPC